MFEYLLYS